jgi:hypothetical protein
MPFILLRSAKTEGNFCGKRNYFINEETPFKKLCGESRLQN